MRYAALMVALLLLPAGAAAQGPVAPVAVEKMPWVAVDIRAGFPAIGDDALTLAGLRLTSPVDMPTRALTGVVGIHVYPLRSMRWKLGLGAELLRGRGHLQKKDVKGKPVGDPINRTLDALSGQVSLNFGRGQGWSYLTVGAGPFGFDSFRGEGPGDGVGTSTINAGGGARWFKWRHVAITADMRFYLTKAAEGTAPTAPRGAKRILVLSAGLSFK